MVMMSGQKKVTIPNPHRGDLDWSLVKSLLQQAAIDPDEWNKPGA